MSTQDEHNTGRLPAARGSTTTDRVGWIAMAVVALLGATVLGWATTLSAG